MRKLYLLVPLLVIIPVFRYIEPTYAQNLITSMYYQRICTLEVYMADGALMAK